MSKFYYASSEFKNVDYVDVSTVATPLEPDRADQLSYVPVSRTVENFISSGRAVSSLRQVTAGLSESNNTDIKTALDTELTAFDRNPYGIDLAEASMEIKRLNAIAEKKDSDSKLAKKVDDAIKAAKGSGETAALGVPGDKTSN